VLQRESTSERATAEYRLPKYVDLVVHRWQALSGKQATLEGDGRSFAVISQERREWSAGHQDGACN